MTHARPARSPDRTGHALRAAAWGLLPCLATLLLLVTGAAHAEDLQRQKAAVVRLTSQADGMTRTGTGFIVRIEPDAVYIATASHVVEGDPAPQVEFYTARNRRVKAEIVKLEKADPKGLGLIAVRGRDRIPAGLNALPFDAESDVESAEEVLVIGFGQGQGDWAVLRAQVISVDGRDLKLDARVEEGNSGGPVLRNGKVVGLITSTGRGIGVATPAQFVTFVLRSWGVNLNRQAAATATAGESQPTGKTKAPAAGRQPSASAATDLDSALSGPKPLESTPANVANAANPTAAPEASGKAGELIWNDHALRFVGAIIDDPTTPSIRARLFDLYTNREIGTYQVPVMADLSQLPIVTFTVMFNVPGDSTTPQPHTHTSNLRFRIDSDRRATLVQNCDPMAGLCYPAQGWVALD